MTVMMMGLFIPGQEYHIEVRALQPLGVPAVIATASRYTNPIRSVKIFQESRSQCILEIIKNRLLYINNGIF